LTTDMCAYGFNNSDKKCSCGKITSMRCFYLLTKTSALSMLVLSLSHLHWDSYHLGWIWLYSVLTTGHLHY